VIAENQRMAGFIAGLSDLKANSVRLNAIVELNPTFPTKGKYTCPKPVP
jgi:hypothetical protein